MQGDHVGFVHIFFNFLSIITNEIREIKPGNGGTVRGFGLPFGGYCRIYTG